MFTTCIHCTQDLGSNESIERFPVGKRIAFDPAKGRLWVVCRSCERWNLSPLDERWEAIEEAERRFRDSRLRVSTDHIGLARLREGLDLIRIGAPQRPEMAAWRYGDQFGRRRKRQLLISGAVVGSAGAILGGMAFAGVSIASFAGIYANSGFWDTLVHGRQNVLVGRIALESGGIVQVQRRHARMSSLERSGRDGPLQLRLESVEGSHLLVGDEARKVAARLMPTVNRFGGSRATVQDAVGLLEEVGDPLEVLTTIQQRHGRSEGDTRWGERPQKGWKRTDRKTIKKLPGTLHSLAPRERLALEMALHEESERRAMDGELAELERAWKEAEEIAKIADQMFVPASVDDAIERLRRNSTERTKE